MTVANPRREEDPSRFAGCGCIYVAYGFEYLVLAAHSALTLKKHNSGLPTTLVTNVPVEPLFCAGIALFDTVIYRDLPSNANRRDKLSVDLLSPYEKTLYLDCDTEIWGDLSSIFLILNRYDFAIRLLNVVSKSVFEVFDGLRADELHLPMWNAGVIFFRKTKKTTEVFERWREIFFVEAMATDQPALMRAILNTRELCLFPLSQLWNAKPTRAHEYGLIESDPSQIRIFHYREPLLRPEIARSLYQTYRNLDARLVPSRCSESERAEELADEKRGLAVRYRYHSLFLMPLNNKFGRSFLQRRKGRFVARLFAGAFRVRALLIGDVRPRTRRNQQASGSRFARVADRDRGQA